MPYGSFGGTSTLQPGNTGVKAMTIPGRNAGPAQSQQQAAQETGALGNPAFGLLGFVGLLILLYFIRKASSYFEANLAGISVMSVLVTTVEVIVGILLLKSLVGRFPIPAITPAILAV